MEDLLVRERAAEQSVLGLLKRPDEPILSVLEAFTNYRHTCQDAIFADFENAELHETRLWQAHTEGKKYFHRALSLLRKKGSDRPVETRQVMKLYLEFIKQSQRFYREYIFRLNCASGGIPDLQAIAQQVKGDSSGESLPLSIPGHLHRKVLDSCHQALIYLGDLSRYRASEKLDKNPDFGPAIGYYDLASSLKPSSGQGHHQQAVVALEQRQHLRAIYHLYRAITVTSPHPNAAHNLRLEFDKTNTAWDKGELIKKGPPADPDASKNALVGWFVRLHSMCFRGEPFRGYEELEREVLSQLATELRQRPGDAFLLRTMLVNIAAQHLAGEKFQTVQTEQYQIAFFYFFRFNVKTFTTLLKVFYDDLSAKLLSLDGKHTDMDAKITPLIRGIMPCLRLYNNWLLSMIHMFVGLVSEDFLRLPIESFWPSYARAIDLIAQAFPIWDLEDIEIDYLFEEDVDTLEFQPLVNEATLKTWYTQPQNLIKKRFSDRDVQRSSTDEEVLKRIHDFLADGLHLANNNDQAPITLRGTRVSYGDGSNLEPLIVRPVEYKPAPIAPPRSQSLKPVSYAAAAANGNTQKLQSNPASRAKEVSKPHSRADELSRMVDDLLEEDDGNNPATPPQQVASHPTVITNGELLYSMSDSAHELAHEQTSHHAKDFTPEALNARAASVLMTPPVARTSPNTPKHSAHNRLQSVSGLWGNTPTASLPSFPSGLPAGALSPPAMANAQSHSRGDSINSIRNRHSPQTHDQIMSHSPAPPTGSENVIPQTIYDATYSRLSQPGMTSPLLFGAGGGLWSTGPQHAFKNMNPNGQGG